VKYVQKLQLKDVEVAEEVNALFAGELNPVAPKAQKKVPIPEGWVLVHVHLLHRDDTEHRHTGHTFIALCKRSDW